MKSRIVFIGLALASASCSNMPWQRQRDVDRDLVAHVADSDRSGIEEARAARNQAADAWDAAKRNTEIAKDQLSLARKEADVAEAELDMSLAAVKMAEKGTTEELAKAKEAQHEHELIEKCVEERIEWRELDVERSKARAELSERRLELTEAQVELARAQAVRALDRPEAKQVDVGDYEYAVRKHEKAVAMAELEVDAVEREARLAHEKFERAVGVVPASYRTRSANLDTEVVYKDDGYEPADRRATTLGSKN
ncbi:MAG: hypothetical protein EPO68_16370 [Planctomycetota bacterium]|nr:MAG: hypothetical protein EPO68_16370 [Planctomycetota bacterium]